MFKKSIDFKKYSSIKIGEKIEVDMIEHPDELKNEHFLIGGCNNLLIGTNPPPLAKLSKKFEYIKVGNGSLIIGAATPLGKVFSFVKKHNIAEFEFLSSLPGTLGGAVFMNAGLKEFEIFKNLQSIKTSKRVLLKDEIDFGYRYTSIDSAILEATFELKQGFDEAKVELFKSMRKNQPSTPSAGSCFKNPPNDYAGRIIEAIGLKGKKVGDMEFSSIHANFLVNHGNGTFDDAKKLIKEAQKKAKELLGVDLELEIKLVDKAHQ